MKYLKRFIHIKIIIAALLFLNVSNAISQEVIKKYPVLATLDYFLLVDQDTGEILLEKNADEIISPSSMTKLMTAYVVFEELKQGRISLANQCLIGRDAWRKRGSTMFLNHGDVVSIHELLSGLLVVSGNDSSVALAQSVSGSVKSFARLMSDTAVRIGMNNSNFKNPHGLNEYGHYMTLRDLATLAGRIAKDFPQFMHYFSIKEFTYRGITQKNRNPLYKGDYYGATGMKTGYTSDGGYGVVGTATRGGRNLIAVTNNALSSRQRQNGVIELLDYGFDNFETITFFDENETIAKASVWLGAKEKLELVAKGEIAVTIPLGQTSENIEFEVKYKEPLFTPIKKDQEVGKLIITIDGEAIREVRLHAKEDVDKASYFSRMWLVFKYKFGILLE